MSESPEMNIPEEWLIEAEATFGRIKTDTNFLTKGEFHQFFIEFLKSCPKEMIDSQPQLESFFRRFSSNQNETFTASYGDYLAKIHGSIIFY